MRIYECSSNYTWFYCMIRVWWKKSIPSCYNAFLYSFSKTFLSFLKHLFYVQVFLWDICSKQARLARTRRKAKRGNIFTEKMISDEETLNGRNSTLARVFNFNVWSQFEKLARRSTIWKASKVAVVGVRTKILNKQK